MASFSTDRNNRNDVSWIAIETYKTRRYRVAVVLRVVRTTANYVSVVSRRVSVALFHSSDANGLDRWL